MAHVANYKKEIVKQLVMLMKKYDMVGIVDMENLPAQQLQKMREKLRDKVTILMTKKRIMKIAFEEVKKDKQDIDKLVDHFKGMPALVFTDQNPFILYKELKKNTSSAPAKAGQTAPKDIEVKAGPTSFAPGPIIGELGAFGIKTAVEGGKIAIKDDVVVCKEGEEISGKLAGILTRMGIEPMEVGLNVQAIYEDGTIFEKNVLDVDEDEFMASIRSAASSAFSLSVEISFITKDNIEYLLTKAVQESHSLSIETAFITKDNVEALLSKAHAQMMCLQGGE